MCTGAGIFAEVNESYGLHIFSASVAFFVTAIRWGLYGVSKRQFLLKQADESGTDVKKTETETETDNGEPGYSHWMYDWVRSTLLYKYVNIK